MMMKVLRMSKFWSNTGAMGTCAEMLMENRHLETPALHWEERVTICQSPHHYRHSVLLVGWLSQTPHGLLVH